MRTGFAIAAVCVAAQVFMARAEAADGLADASGRALMEQVHERHRRYPYVFEQQSMVLVDRNGDRETRRLDRYTRVDSNGDIHILLHFRFPREVQGVAMLAVLGADGRSSSQVFLPALGHYLIANGPLRGNGGPAAEDHFLGTDFTIENLIGEDLNDYRFERQRDTTMAEAEYFVVDVHAANPNPGKDYALRRHFISKDGLFVTRTDHFDPTGRVTKRQTHYDLTVVNGETWRANMMLMDNLQRNHQTIIKIDRRIFSPDYVPAEIFTPEWIFANAPEPDIEPPAFEELDPSEYLRELATGRPRVGP